MFLSLSQFVIMRSGLVKIVSDVGWISKTICMYMYESIFKKKKKSPQIIGIVLVHTYIHTEVLVTCIYKYIEQGAEI